MSNLMPPGWTAHQAPDGRWYYAHSSGLTQWNPPAPQPAYGAPPPPPGGYSGGHQGYPQQPLQHHGSGSSSGRVHGGHGGGGYKPHHGSPSSNRYVYNHPVEFKLKEKTFSLSGDSFSIKNVATGEGTFKVKGNAMSFKDSKSLYDMHGRPIYKMSEALLSLRGRMQIQDANSKRTVVTLRKKGFIPHLGTGTIQVWKGGTDEGEPWLEVKGDYLKKDFDIKEPGSSRIIGSVKRKSFNLSNILLEKDSYVIRIEPGQDAALLVFLVIAIDETYRDDGERKGLGQLF